MSAARRAYETVHSFTAELGDEAISFFSKPGMPHWDSVSPASQLLGEVARPANDARVLLIGGHAALGVALARRVPAGEVVLLDISAIAAEMGRRTLEANAIGNARVWDAISVLPERAAQFDMVAIEAPSDRKLARRWLAEAHQALLGGGVLYLAGANDHGIRSIVGDAAALFGDAAVLGYKRGQRVARADRRASQTDVPDWADSLGIAPDTWYEFEIVVRGQTLRLRSLPGVFAHDRLDEGTRLLVEAIEPPIGARVLDIGCGSGAIGLLAARLGAAQVDLVDASLLAVAAAQENIRQNQVAGARAFACDGVPADRRGWYDLILTNPPFHVGKAVDYEVAHAFIGQARRALKDGGQFVLVANQFIRYDQLLRSAFAHVDCVTATRSFRVWRAVA
jgi:16S rRNA (guanine1207-N2)-methyltransferase